jgi:hypothetical protein
MTIKHLLLALPCLLLTWLGILVAVSLMSDAAPAYVVILPGPDFTARLDPDMSIMTGNRLSMTITVAAPDAAARLYDAGGILVLPAGLPGCLPLPDPARN